MNKIYSSVPLNSLAAIVTNQKGCSDGTITIEQQIDILRLRAKKIRETLSTIKHNDPRKKMLGMELHEIQNKLSIIKQNKRPKDGIADYFMDCAREFLTKEQFKIIWGNAVKRQQIKAEGGV